MKHVDGRMTFWLRFNLYEIIIHKESIVAYDKSARGRDLALVKEK
jgi:hypothetical protein